VVLVLSGPADCSCRLYCRLLLRSAPAVFLTLLLFDLTDKLGALPLKTINNWTRSSL